MLELVLDCGLFVSIDNNEGNYYQICGETDNPDIFADTLHGAAADKAFRHTFE